jgi:L,D-transpeptidase catalytic domain
MDGVRVIMRLAWIVSAGFIGVRLMCGQALAEPAAEPPPHHVAHAKAHMVAHMSAHLAAHAAAHVDVASAEAIGAPPDAPPVMPAGAAPVHHVHHVHRRVAAETPEQLLHPLPMDALSDQEDSVSEIADQNGDKTFLMVDKALGRILLFEDGKPVFMGRALTGESTADNLPPNELREKFDNLDALQYKVTPAGRFTVVRGFDNEYGGPLLDVKEIKGKDWGIAIHQVYLGIPAEHRAERLQSPRDDDKNITFGCINVTRETIKLLLRELPENGATALYVLPRDEPNTATYFAPHNS